MFMVEKIDKKIELKIDEEIELKKQFANFLLYLRSEKNASTATETSYTTDFKIFLEFLKKSNFPTNMRKLDTNEIRAYVVYLKNEKKYKNATVRRKINSLKSFSKYLVEMDYIEKDPTRAIHAPKKEKRLPKYFTVEQLKRLFETAKNSREPYALRDYMFIKIIAKCGLRRSEAIKLNFSDADFDKNIIKVKGKGRKERVVPIDNELSDELFIYLQSRLPLKNEAMFINSAGNRINAAKAQQIFTKLMQKAGLANTGLTLHSLRHSYATYLVKSGTDISKVQKLLGHEDIGTTIVYTHTNVEDLREDIEQLPY